jgi:hypothetical protein
VPQKGHKDNFIVKVSITHFPPLVNRDRGLPINNFVSKVAHGKKKYYKNVKYVLKRARRCDILISDLVLFEG